MRLNFVQKRNVMGKRIGRNDGFYKEALAWMGYRYAMGMTDYVGERGYSELERYRQFMDIDFGSEEFRALVGAFCDFLKRRKIKDVIDLKERYLEQDLIWLSKNYAMGRHSYAASHWQDIVRYGCDVLTEEQRRHNAMDIRRMTALHLQFGTPMFRMPYNLEEYYSPMDLFLTFISEKGIDSEEELARYKSVSVEITTGGKIAYQAVMQPEGEESSSHFWAHGSIDDYLGWDALASFFYPPCHKTCRVRYDGKEELVRYFDAWQRRYNADGKMHYEKVKVSIDKFRQEPWAGWSLNEENVVEDEVDDNQVMASTVAVDEYFDELIEKVRQDNANL